MSSAIGPPENIRRWVRNGVFSICIGLSYWILEKPRRELSRWVKSGAVIRIQADLSETPKYETTASTAIITRQSPMTDEETWSRCAALASKGTDRRVVPDSG